VETLAPICQGAGSFKGDPQITQITQIFQSFIGWLSGQGIASRMMVLRTGHLSVSATQSTGKALKNLCNLCNLWIPP
jgi:hypothetical protein